LEAADVRRQSISVGNGHEEIPPRSRITVNLLVFVEYVKDFKPGVKMAFFAKV
jgi:hypothetical protein